MRTTPFYDRTSALNQTGLWDHWAGYLSARQYHFSEKLEYFAVRTAVGVYDTSPLYKYRIHGKDAESFLAGVLARDVRSCKPGMAQYTIWCDDDGYVIEDGMLFRTSESEFMLTAAEPNAAYFQDLIGRAWVEVEDVSEDLASLAVQGPRSKAILSTIAPDIAELRPFEVIETKLNGSSITVSRTGFTGDLGYELWIESEDALDVWDGLFEIGVDHGLMPFGETALVMTRLEAGLLLIGADFGSSRYAWTDGASSTPGELGLGWMFRDIRNSQRPFIGRDAIRRDLDGSGRRRLVGLTIDWEQWDDHYSRAGHVPPKDHTPMAEEIPLFDKDQKRAGFATSFMYSPMAQRHIAIAQVLPEFSALGSEVDFEVTIDHVLHYIKAVVTKMPFYDPPHRTA
jgi:glycine cleavage system T protein (aminomethyltransferase)